MLARMELRLIEAAPASHNIKLQAPLPAVAPAKMAVSSSFTDYKSTDSFPNTWPLLQLEER